MLKQFSRFIFLAIIVAAALYITLTNSDPATIKLGPNISVTAYAGVIYIAVFALGCVAASLVALFFGLKGYLRERRLRSAERVRQNFYRSFEQARNQMAAGDWGAARLTWEDVLARDGDNVVARVELSRCVEQLGDTREALRVLDSARASSRSSAEALYRAAELNSSLGNNTAALDNLALILAQAPSRRALELARDLSSSVARYDQALSYHDELEKIGYSSEANSSVRAELTLRQLLKEATGDSQLKEALASFVKKYPSFASGYEELAKVERRLGNLDGAAENLVKSARFSDAPIDAWRSVVDLWLNADGLDRSKRSERALAAARSATKDQRGVARLEAELILIKTLLAVNHFQEAERAIEGFKALAEREVGKLSPELLKEIDIQKGHCLSQMGNARETAPLWHRLACPDAPAEVTQKASQPGASAASRAEPSPSLSTP